MRERFDNLQALRGVACLLVVGVHTWKLEASFGLQTPVLREFRWFGVAGVDLFFVLSGFIITSTNRQNLGRAAAVPGYLFRRFWRIYPTYWAVLAVAAAIPGLLIGRAVYQEWSPADWIRWVCLAPPVDSNAFVGQAWTLTYEVMFYLAFGLLMLAPRRCAAGLLCGWAAAVLVAGLGRGRSGPPGLLLSPFVLEFLGGCLVAWLTGRGVRAWPRVALGLGVGYAAAGVAWVANASRDYLTTMAAADLRVVVFGPAAVLIVYGLVAAEGVWPRRVPRWLLRTGDASYSLYLLHPTVLWVALVVGYKVPHSRLPHTLWVGGTVAAVLLSGYLFYALVERPLLNLGKRRRPAGPPAVAAPERRAAA